MLVFAQKRFDKDVSHAMLGDEVSKKDMEKLLLRRDVQVAADRQLAMIAAGQQPWVPFADAFAVALKRKEAGLLQVGKYEALVASCTHLDVPGILHYVAERKSSKKTAVKTKPSAAATTQTQLKSEVIAPRQVASIEKPAPAVKKATKRARSDAGHDGQLAAAHAAGTAKKPRTKQPKAKAAAPAPQLEQSSDSDSVHTVSTDGAGTASVQGSRPAQAAPITAAGPVSSAMDEDPVPARNTTGINMTPVRSAVAAPGPPGSAASVAGSVAGAAAAGQGGAGAAKEKRSRSYRKVLSAKTAKAISQAKEQRLYIVGERDVTAHSGTFLVWCKGALSKVAIGKECSCTCPAGAKGDICKHHMFVMLRAFGRREDDVLAWQGGLLSNELAKLFAERPNPLNNGGKTAASKVATAESNAKRCLVVKGDACPVCFLPVVKGGVEPLVWCRAHCGQNVHAECMKQKSEFHASAQCRVEFGNNVTPCPYCAKAWLEAPAK